ncbi:MAG: hypothetical protein WEF50_18290 [Myxococcota bacterium]
MSAPDFHPKDLPEPLDPGAGGVRIAATPFRRPDGVTSLRVVGIARLPKDQIGSLPSVLHATSITVTRAQREPFSARVVGDAIVFPDDVVDEGASQRACFAVDPFALARREPAPGRYFVSAFGGALLSNVVVVEIAG